MDAVAHKRSVIGARLVLALVAGCLAAGVAAPGAASAAAIGGFSIRPAEFNPADPVTRAYFKLLVRAGHRFTGSVIAENTKRTPVELRVYAVDGLTGVTSGAVYGNLADPLHKTGRWLTPTVSHVTLAPRSESRVSFTIAVPRSASPGDHLAGIAVEDAHPRRTHGQFAITQVLRAVVGVEIRVPGPAAAAAKLTSVALKPLPGTHVASVVIGLVNSGRLLCQPRLSVALQGDGRARDVTRQLDTLLPGDAIPYPLAWPASLVAGEYRVSSRVTGCGPAVSLSTVVHASGRLTGASATPSAQPPVIQTVTPWWLLALVAAAGMLAGLTIGIALYARRRKRDEQRHTVPAAGSR